MEYILPANGNMSTNQNWQFMRAEINIGSVGFRYHRIKTFKFDTVSHYN